MKILPSRQIHLDFHTSGKIPAVGSCFDKGQFQHALKLGHVNSITVFAKCHHSWCYFPTKVGKMHPELDFDLTGSMIAAAHEIGVRAPVYITVGWSAEDADNHPEWVVREKNGEVGVFNYDVHADPESKKPIVSWKLLCPNGPYAEHIYALTEEICARYPKIDGLFYDICFWNNACYCDACMEGMNKGGYNPDSVEAAKQYSLMKRRQFMEECTRILRNKSSEGTLFFNGGADIYQPQWHPAQTHFEMEDLPTAMGGYDKMPLRAKYFAKSGKEYLGMTGKFHTNWGEFGGFKAPEALRYECSAMLAYGAGCSVGDQLHPSGEMDLETYRIIGEAYEYVEQMESYCFHGEETSNLGILLSGNSASDEGLTKILLDTQIDFDVVSGKEDIRRFSTVILPDCVSLQTDFAEELNRFVREGGGILLTGTSGLDQDKTRFLLDIGAQYLGKPKFEIDYVKAGEAVSSGIVKSPFLFYDAAQRVKVKGAEVLASVREPYFDRTYRNYCSHQNTPFRLEDADHPAAIRYGNVVYLAHSVCRLYFEHGAQFHRDYFINALKLIQRKPVLEVSMPSSGRVRLVKQPKENRYVLHLLYATPIQRGAVSVIEDMPTLHDVSVYLRIEEVPRKIILLQQNSELQFAEYGDRIEFTVPTVQCHAIVTIEY